MDKLRGCNFTSDPFTGSIDEISAWISSQPDATASAFHPEKGQLNQILVNRKGQIERCDVSEVNPKQFCSQVDLDASLEGLAGRLTRYSQSSPFAQYEIQTVQPGDVVRGITYDSHSFNVFCLTDRKDGNYFDLVVYPVKANENPSGVVNYSTKNVDGATHSGDVGSLYHGVRLVPKEDVYYVVGVVGFRKRFLRMFTDQLPCLAIASTETQTVSVIPLNLAQAVCGDSTMGVLAVLTRDGRQSLKCAALSRQMTAPNIDTCDTNAAVYAAVREAVANAREIFATKPVIGLNCKGDKRSASESDQSQSKPSPNAGQAVVSPEMPQTVVFYEDGLDYSRNRLVGSGQTERQLFIGLGTGLDVFDTEEGFVKGRYRNQPFERLPVLGRVNGPPSALTTCPRYNGQLVSLGIDFLDKLEGSRLIEFHLSAEWNRIAANGATRCCNGLFIIHVKSDTGPAVSITQQLEHLNRDCLAIAGPYSIALAEIEDRLYWYRGVTWRGLTDTLPEFAADVTDLFSSDRVGAWIREPSCELPWSKLDDVANPTFWFDGETIHGAKQLRDKIGSLEMDSLDIDQIRDATTAMSIACTPEQLTPLIQELAVKLQGQVEKGLLPLKRQIKELSAKSMDGDREAKHQIGRLIGEMRALKRKITPLTTHLHNLSSQRASSTRKADINRLVRAATIKANVDRVKSMTESQKSEYIESVDEWMIIALNASLTPHLKVLGSKSTSTFRDAVYNGHIAADESLVGLLTRCPQLDGVTVSCLVECGQQGSHPMSGTSSWAMSQGQSATDQSAFPIPILEMFDDMKSPYGVAWCELTNHPEVSTYRIGLRSTICNATASRTFNINPASRELTFFLIYLFLNIAKSITHNMTVPGEADFDSTTCRMTRCLVGLAVTTAASGNTPACDAFTIFGVNPKVVPHNETWIVSLLAEVMPYTGWDLKPFQRNLTFYLVRAIRRNLTDPATEGLRREISSMEAKEQSDRMAARNEELRFARLAIRALFYIKDEGLESSERAQNIAERVLTRLPEKRTWFLSSTDRMIGFLSRVSNRNADWSRFSETLETAANVYTRRSAYFKAVKTQLRDVLDGKKAVSEAKAVSMVMAAREQIAKYHPDQPRVQNWKAIEALDLAAIKGDAEIKRSPFTLYGFEPVDRDTVQQIDNFILRGQHAPLGPPATNDDTSSRALARQENRAVAALSRYPGSGYDLAKRLETLQLTDFNLGSGVAGILAATGCDVPQLRRVAEDLLVNWRDAVLGESVAFDALNNYH